MALRLQAVGELGACGGLARTLQADEHDDAGGLLAQVERDVLPAQQLGELIDDDLHDVLPRRERIHDIGGQAALLRAAAKAFHHAEVDVCLEQRHADLLDARIYIGLGKVALRAEPVEDVLQFLG